MFACPHYRGHSVPIKLVSALLTVQVLSALLGHVNKISCFSSFCLQKFGEGGGYLLFIFRGQRSYATIFTGVKLGYKTKESRGEQERHRSKKSENEQKNGSMDVRMLELSFIFTIANESVM